MSPLGKCRASSEEISTTKEKLHKTEGEGEDPRVLLMQHIIESTNVFGAYSPRDGNACMAAVHPRAHCIGGEEGYFSACNLKCGHLNANFESGSLTFIFLRIWHTRI